MSNCLEQNSIPIPVQMAATIGIAESILLQQIHYWLGKDCGRIVNGVRWIYNTYLEWQAQIPCLTLSTIRRAIARLEGQKLIKSERFDEKRWNQTKFYTIDYERLKALQLSICSNEAAQEDQNEHVNLSEMSSSYTETTYSEISPQINTLVVEKEAEEEQEVEEEQETKENTQQPTSQELSEAFVEIRVVSSDINFNSNVRKAIISYWANFPAAIAQLKKAVRENWRCNLTGVFINALKEPPEQLPPPPPVKIYPQPTPEQREQLGALGRLVHTTLDEPGYPQVLAVDTGKEVLPWWIALNT